MSPKKRNMNKAAIDIAPAGMFIFSKPMYSEKSLIEWKGYFLSKGINAVIVNDKNGKYYLCREGIEATMERWLEEKSNRRSYRRR